MSKENPTHYDGLDCFRCIQDFCAFHDLNGIEGFSYGNAIKYLWRAGRKNTETEADDLAKVDVYLKLILESYPRYGSPEETRDLLIGFIRDWRAGTLNPRWPEAT